jgi:hypothetical protein
MRHSKDAALYLLRQVLFHDGNPLLRPNQRREYGRRDLPPGRLCFEMFCTESRSTATISTAAQAAASVTATVRAAAARTATVQAASTLHQVLNQFLQVQTL